MIGELEIQSPLEVAEEMLDSLPVDGSRIRVVLGQLADSVDGVGTCADCKVHQCADCAHVGDILHCLVTSC